MMKSLSRRQFFQAGAVAGVSAGVAAGAGLALAGDASASSAATSVPLFGTHPRGVIEPVARSAAFVSFDVVADSRSELVDLMHTITEQVVYLTQGGMVQNAGPASPTADDGILGPVLPADDVRLTVGLGASLFDDRFGLTAQKPAHLTAMTTFANDSLDPAQCHGDLLLQATAEDADTVIHAVRQIAKMTRGGMQPRWRVDGFTSPPRPSGTPRNLLGFKDGTANPALTEADQLIWVQPGGGEPAWTAGGSYEVVRIIRMLVEFWDRVSLKEQENMIGRHRDSGAPQGGLNEDDPIDYSKDPGGRDIRLDSHIRVANPRTAGTAKNQILRRGYNYDRGLDSNGNLDQGLVFTCFQQDIQRQFEAVQTRLADEPLVDYISPIGGGYFFVPPGLRSASDVIGGSLFA